MRLMEAIVGADSADLVDVNGFGDDLPLVVLTCVDPRLNRIVPKLFGALGPEFIWLRNAGNVIADPISGMARSMALACVIKGGREIAVIGHTDCQVRATTANSLIERFASRGIGRARLPENLVESFGLFASERQNVVNGVELLRRSPIIPPSAPIHGLILDLQTERLEFIVNGYDPPPANSGTQDAFLTAKDG